MKFIAILFVLMQISIFGVYKVPSASLMPNIKRHNMILANRLSFGLHVPFVTGTIIEWSLPKKNDIVVVRTKANKNLLKRVFGLPQDVFVANGKRFVVPDDFI